MRIYKSIASIIFLALITTVVKSQDQTIVIESSNDTLLYGNYLELSITYNNIETGSPELEFQGFTILSQPNVSSQYQNINGHVTQSKTYTYYLEPNEEGFVEIPPIKLTLSDTEIMSNGISIVVLPNPEGIVTTPERNENSFFFDWSQPRLPKKEEPQSAPDPLKKKRKKI